MATPGVSNLFTSTAGLNLALGYLGAPREYGLNLRSLSRFSFAGRRRNGVLEGEVPVLMS